MCGVVVDMASAATSADDPVGAGAGVGAASGETGKDVAK